MLKKNHFNQVQNYYASLRSWLIIYKEKHPERVIAAMFLILLIAVTILLITKAAHKESYKGSVSALVNKISAPAAATPGKPITTDIMGLLSLYGKTQAINPDSLTLNDSVLIKEMDKDLNKILNEKD